jgi:hypothetical protein
LVSKRSITNHYKDLIAFLTLIPTVLKSRFAVFDLYNSFVVFEVIVVFGFPP